MVIDNPTKKTILFPCGLRQAHTLAHLIYKKNKVLAKVSKAASVKLIKVESWQNTKRKIIFQHLDPTSKWSSSIRKSISREVCLSKNMSKWDFFKSVSDDEYHEWQSSIFKGCGKLAIIINTIYD